MAKDKMTPDREVEANPEYRGRSEEEKYRLAQAAKLIRLYGDRGHLEKSLPKE